jgi:hypothetical protein
MLEEATPKGEEQHIVLPVCVAQATSPCTCKCLLLSSIKKINPLTPELNRFAQRCLTRYFTGNFASLTVHFVNICVKNQQIHQLFIQFINYV